MVLYSSYAFTTRTILFESEILFFFFGIIRDYQSRLESLPTFQLGFSEHTDFFHLNNKGNLVVWLILRMSNGALTRVVFEGQLCCSC